MKINFGQNLVAMNGEALRIGQYGLDSRTVAVIVQEVVNKCELPTEYVVKLQNKLNEVSGKPLTLSEAVVTSLLSPYEEEKALPGSERIKRVDLARKCNKLGMVKITDAHIKDIMPLVEKFYRGALISPQIELLLQGKPFLLTEPDEDEDGEDGKDKKDEGAPKT